MLKNTLTSKSDKTFKGISTEEKYKLINWYFTNLGPKDTKLVYTLHPPLDAFVKIGKNEEWCTLEDSNLRPTD